MSLTVRDRAEHFGVFRFISVHAMETLAAWVPTTAEMEVKLLFGSHIWTVAQQADRIGQRTRELRAPLHYTRRPADEYVALLAELAAATDTARRIHGFYDVFVAGLAQRYRRYVGETDTLMDEPGVRILESGLTELTTMRRQSEELRQEFPALVLAEPAWVTALGDRESAMEDIVRARSSADAGAVDAGARA